MEPVIRVEHISKKYKLKTGGKSGGYTTFREKMVDGVKGVLSGSAFKTSEATEFWALDDVSFDVFQGDRVGIIGRNGAGKSTLLKILSRIVAPTKGKFTMDGRLGSLLEVGTGFHPELSGRENIFLNGALLGMSKTEIKRKFDEIVEFAEVKKFLDTPVKRYSSGMYVRLAFAVAANLEPEILIVDEVLAVGDAAFQKKCLGKMEDVSSQGRTVLFVSHNMESVQKLCNKGILLAKGKLVESGGINEVISKYLDTYSSGHLTFEIPVPSDEAELTAYSCNVSVTDSAGRVASEIVIGENYQIHLEFIVKKPVKGFVAAIGISSAFGMPIRTIWSKPQDLSEGKYVAVFKNDDISLASGQYKLTAGLSSEKRVLHYAEGCGLLVISDVSGIADDERIINTQSGLIINQMEVQIAKTAN